MGRPAAATAYTAAMDALFSPEMVTVLMVDDDAELAAMVAELLRAQGMQVHSAGTAAQGLAALTRLQPDVLLLDLMLPDANGLDLCRRLREAGNDVPVLMLTARGDPFDRVLGLELGADDYLGKPFNPRELLARIHAVLRRRPPTEVPGAPSQDQEVVKFGPFEFDLSLRTLRKDGADLPLTTGEFAMLKALVRHPRQPLSREKLAQLARGREFEPFDRSLDVQVSRLRKLIEEDAASPRYLQTVWGVGYVFVPDGNA